MHSQGTICDRAASIESTLSLSSPRGLPTSSTGTGLHRSAEPGVLAAAGLSCVHRAVCIAISLWRTFEGNQVSFGRSGLALRALNDELIDVLSDVTTATVTASSACAQHCTKRRGDSDCPLNKSSSCSSFKQYAHAGRRCLPPQSEKCSAVPHACAQATCCNHHSSAS